MTGSVGFLRCYDYECEYNQLNKRKGLKRHIERIPNNEGGLWGFCERHHAGEKLTISKSRYCVSGNP